MKIKPRVITTISAVLAIAVVSTAMAADSPKPNILFIVGDDMGYADVVFHGCKDIPTPNLDALAKSGVKFTNGYVTSPYCSPTRAAMLTGRYQNRFGHEFNQSGDQTPLLPNSEPRFNVPLKKQIPIRQTKRN